MSTVTRKRYVRAFILAVIILIILLRFDACDPTNRAPDGAKGSGSGQTGTLSASFTIEGNAAESIAPGVMVPLDLEITNPHDFPMSVTGFAVTVQEVNAPNASVVLRCSPADFTLDQANSLAITIAARSTSTLSSLDLARRTWPHIGMLNRSVNQDGCKGASLTLDYTAIGRVEN